MTVGPVGIQKIISSDIPFNGGYVVQFILILEAYSGISRKGCSGYCYRSKIRAELALGQSFARFFWVPEILHYFFGSQTWGKATKHTLQAKLQIT